MLLPWTLMTLELRAGAVSHRINTRSSSSIRQQVWQIPQFCWEEAKQLLQDVLKKDVIQPSDSPWASLVVVVCKKNGSIPFCVDYQKVNAVTQKDAYPLPRINDTLDMLSGSQWFSTLNLVSRYWQVEVLPEDRKKIAFCPPEGLYEFNDISFGLCNAPATFQWLMESTIERPAVETLLSLPGWCHSCWKDIRRSSPVS